MSSAIINAAIHHLVREENVYRVTQGNSAVAVTATSQRLIDELHKLYARRPSKSYGKFSTDTVNYPTSTALKSYIENTTSFADFSIALMNTLAIQAQAKVASTGGHVFIAHFSNDSIHYLMVAIVSDKTSAALNGANNLHDVTHLDVDGFRFAGRISIDGWAAGGERYIGFLKGKGEVSEYFKAFLGCDTSVLARVETASLVQALKSFADAGNFDAGGREAFMTRALQICEREAKQGSTIEFERFANELYPTSPSDLIETLADPNRALAEGFIPDRRALRGLVNFKRKTANWSVEFERKSLHSGKVRYNPAEKSITLFDVPDDLSSELEEEVRLE